MTALKERVALARAAGETIMLSTYNRSFSVTDIIHESPQQGVCVQAGRGQFWLTRTDLKHLKATLTARGF